MGKACEIANINIIKHINVIRRLRDYYIARLQRELKDIIRINGGMQNRLPGNANISFLRN